MTKTISAIFYKRAGWTEQKATEWLLASKMIASFSNHNKEQLMYTFYPEIHVGEMTDEYDQELGITWCVDHGYKDKRCSRCNFLLCGRLDRERYFDNKIVCFDCYLDA